MRVTQEMLDKLSREKRKDYIEQKEKISDFRPLAIFTTYILWTIYIFAFSLIVVPLWKIAYGPTTSITISKLFISLLMIMKFLIIIGLLIDIICIIIFMLTLQKLKERYFGKLKKRHFRKLEVRFR